ncbi:MULTISPECIES: fasciclin domain-containing protein [Isoptericola]|uniref:Fasciclin domain-containing protein n=1 Tax=Isoptericola sediminis TaxID=2733572 RepID=A0A849KC04_9MICO|nr:MULTISPECIES: fasciclin domain-containing protein [Isoptericola]MDO8145582.1 fasciclin domain-containing protein [Isoptericola sp. 178]MDO8149222.1 fasciclin domain-containing protein [Isoptericola sp. b515]MDO8152161.1 fasciclin domain-containing protein [Isoptericola sp. b408]NNU26123.1 fasciclin domain-containing protein [Isoptericola sediminis]
MKARTRTRTAAAGFATLALLALGACSTDDGDTAGSEETMTEESPMEEESMAEEDMESEDDMAEEDMEMDPAANLVGPGCEDYASQVPDGAGSIEGMSTEPVAVAASNNPLLTTLTAAVSGELNPDVNLVDTLNGGEFTVFAPVDEAFEAVDAETIDALSTDADLLTSVLTYHVVEGQALPEDVVGEHTTVQGETVEVTGEGDELTVNDAGVICGGVMTQNATVYLIDGVLMPTM